ncbi:M42 family metallopeptidase [Halanaerobaculum tunisiense]
MKKLIKKLVETYGPAGAEAEIREVIKAKIKDHVDQIKVDTMGNLIALKKGRSSDHKVMLAAHMDEIGVIATHIDEDGFIRFSPVGGVPTYTLLGERVLFNGQTVGVIDKEEEVEEINKLQPAKMYIDIGASSHQEAAEKISLGDTACYYRQLNNLGDRITAKSLDDRAGCAVLIDSLQRLNQPTYDTYFVFTTQEEVGTRGSQVSAYGIDPDLGIAVDLTLTGDTPEAKCRPMSLGDGPAIKVKDRSVLANPQVKDLLVELAQANEIPYQLEVLQAGGTDAGSMQLTKDGVLAGAISIPARYVHSPSEIIDISDLENGVKLLNQLLTSSYKQIL